MISVLIPTLNEVGSIEGVLRSIPESFREQVLVVDGHSKDGTLERARELGFRAMKQDGRGLGRAIDTGIRHTTGDVIIVMDADGSYSGEDIPRFLAKIEEGYDLVVASRYSDGPEDAGMFSPKRKSTSEDDTPIHALGNRLFTWVCRVLFGIPIHDVLNGYRAFRRSVVLQVPIETPGQEYDMEQVLRMHTAGFRLADIPVVERKRTAGESKLSVTVDGTKILWQICREFARSRLRRPKPVATQVRSSNR